MPRAVGADLPLQGVIQAGPRFLSRDGWDRPREGRPHRGGGGEAWRHPGRSLGLLGVSIPGRCCGSVLGAVRDASPCCRSSRSRLVSGREGVAARARCAGLVGSGPLDGSGSLRGWPVLGYSEASQACRGCRAYSAVGRHSPGLRTPLSSARLGECQGGRETEDRQRACDGLGQWTEHRVSPLCNVRHMGCVPLRAAQRPLAARLAVYRAKGMPAATAPGCRRLATSTRGWPGEGHALAWDARSSRPG